MCVCVCVCVCARVCMHGCVCVCVHMTVYVCIWLCMCAIVTLCLCVCVVCVCECDTVRACVVCECDSVCEQDTVHAATCLCAHVTVCMHICNHARKWTSTWMGDRHINAPQQPPGPQPSLSNPMQQPYLKTCRGLQHLAGSGGSGERGGRGRRLGGGKRGRGRPGTGRRASLWCQETSLTDWTLEMVSQRPPYLEMVICTLR